MEKVDLKKALKSLYDAPVDDFQIVVVPPLSYFMVDGVGDPNSSAAYAEAIELLFGISYTLKFLSKGDLGRDYVVPPLESLWWADDMRDFQSGNKDKWKWTAMIMIPEWITSARAHEALSRFAAKNAEVDATQVRSAALDEGLSVQILHVGSYADEGPTLARLHGDYLPTHRLVPNGKHHEIYLSDPRRVEPARLKTILRQPVKAI